MPEKKHTDHLTHLRMQGPKGSRHSDESRVTAASATKIQAMVRGRQARKVGHSLLEKDSH